jgi:hypothetical protein
MKNIQSIIFCSAALSFIATQYSAWKHQAWKTDYYRVQCIKEYSAIVPRKDIAIAFAVNFCGGGGGITGK